MSIQPPERRLVTEATLPDRVDQALTDPESPAHASLLGTIGTEVSGAVAAGTVARGVLIDANLHGVVADGVTDDQPAWQAIVNAASPGDTITWTGKSMLHDRIVWRTGISIIGQGWGRSILATYDDTGEKYFSAIDFTPNSMGASLTNTIDDCTFANFEIDGSGLSGTARHIGAKGIFGQFMRRCQFLNLFIHDTIGTGLGTDYMPDCLVHGVIAQDCGRNWLLGGGGGGQANIGIGTGAWEDESLTISDCHAISTDPENHPAHWGIFVEWQDGQPYHGRGIRVVNCSATGAVYGFGDRGTAGTTFVGCTAYGNTTAGFKVENITTNGLMTGCSSYDNGGDGFAVDSTLLGTYTWRGNKAFDNGKAGFMFPISNSTVPHVTVESNEAYGNQEAGIRFTSSVASGKFTDLVVRGNRVWNNGQGGGNAFTTRGIRFDANLERFDVSGNDATDTQATKTQLVGMALGGSFAFTDGRIENNTLRGNGTGNVASALAPDGTKTNVRIAGNLGYATENTGTATIADGATSVTVPHGLANAPTTVQLGRRSDEDVWVSARTTTNLTITRAGTAGSLTVDWTAVLRPT